MKEVYLKVVDRLKTVPALTWIDADEGQLDFYDEKPPVAFPCALVDIDMPNSEDLTSTIQHCDIRITIRYAFFPTGQTNHKVPTAVQTKALERWDTINAGFKALQGWGDTEVSSFSRKSQVTEKRDDNLKVVVQTWECTFMEDA